MATFTPGDSGFTTLTDNLEALYVGYFGRAADQQGLTFWANAINSGQATLATVEAFFVLQPEAQAKYPFLASPSVATIDPFITTIYQDLFNRGPDASGLMFWHNYLAANINNSFAVGQFIGFVINGATGTDATTLTNKVTVADFNTSTFAAAGITSFNSSTPAGQASIKAIASVDSTAASVTAAQAAITQFAQNGNTTNVFLTTGVDNQTQGFAKDAAGTQPLNGFTANVSNITFNGTVGGGGTWTPGDQVTAASGTTGQSFNLVGTPATQGVIDITGVAGAKVLNIQTASISSAVNASGVPFQAFKGDFTATGPQGAWVGLAALNVTSGGNAAGADNVTVGSTAVTITDTLFAATTSQLTVIGGTVDTITENNSTHNNGGIVVTGISATTSVSVTQTEALNTTGHHGIVTITDAGFATKAAGTITTVVLDGLTGHNFSVPPHNVINDNALATLTVNNSDTNFSYDLNDHSKSGTISPANAMPTTDVGATLDINNNQATPTATTLTLSLDNNGLDPDGDGSPEDALLIHDTNSEITTLHLSVGPHGTFTHLVFEGLTTLDTATGGGKLIGFIDDEVAAAVNLNFSGLNGPNDIEVDRGATLNNDIYTLGNFGTDNGYFTSNEDNSQEFQVDNTNPGNVGTINFGSGAYEITIPSTHGTWNYVQTAANGTGLISGLSATPTMLAQWADFIHAHNGDTLLFKTDSVQSLDDQGTKTVTAGITASLATPAHTASFFRDGGGNTFVFDHADSNMTGITAADSLVEFENVTFTGLGAGHSSLAAGGLITLHS
jgi:hypothetical protein